MTSRTGSLDANILLRLLLNDIPAQHAAATRLVEDSAGQLNVADTSIIEVVFVLERHYGFTREQIAVTIQGLIGLPQITCSRALFEKSLPLFAEHPALSFEDCCLAVYAELNGALPLYTFDKKLAHQTPQAQLLT